MRYWIVQMAVQDPQDVEGGGAHNAGRAASIQYGAAEGAHIRPAQSRAWATFGAVALMCALVGTARWAQETPEPGELAARGRRIFTGHSLESIFSPPDSYSMKKMSFVKGESHMMNVSCVDPTPAPALREQSPPMRPAPQLTTRAQASLLCANARRICFRAGSLLAVRADSLLAVFLYVEYLSLCRQDVLSAESTKHELEDHIYQLIHPGLLAELQKEIEREMKEEVQEAVDKEQQEYYLRNTANIQHEMGAVMKDVDAQKSINAQFTAMVTRAQSLEKEICKGESCEDWDTLLAGAQKKVDALRKELALERKTHHSDLDRIREEDKDLTADMDSDEQTARTVEQDLTYWRGLANVYYAMLHPRTAPMQTPSPPLPSRLPPPPPHCSGLKLIYGAAGSISSGPAGTATDLEHNDCRWIIKSPNAEIVLRFPNLKVFGSDGRVSIFVGPENVALYKNEDVVNWASAYKSFTGLAYPAPIVCPAGEVGAHMLAFPYNALHERTCRLIVRPPSARNASHLCQRLGHGSRYFCRCSSSSTPRQATHPRVNST